jgi:fructokinase
VKVFRNSELKEAIEFAIENEQIAIFDLTNLKEIKIK